MLAKSARTNLRRSMIKLKGSTFASEEYNNAIQDVRNDIESVFIYWDPKEGELVPEDTLNDFITYLFSGQFRVDHHMLMGMCAGNLKDKELENCMTLVMFFFNMNEDKKGDSRYLNDKHILENFCKSLYKEVDSDSSRSSHPMKSAVKHQLEKMFGEDVKKI